MRDRRRRIRVVRDPDGSVRTVNGSGYGPDGGIPDFYRDRGLSAIPLDGALAVAVPGAPAALAALHAYGASMSLLELWEPAARIAERGLPCSAKTRADVQAALHAIRSDVGLASVYTPTGAVPRVGDRLPQVDLARTIRALASDPSSFYTGAIAEHCVAALQYSGAPFTGDEWVAGASVPVESALTGTYAGTTVHQTPLPTPGGWCCSRPRCATESSARCLAERSGHRPYGACRSALVRGPIAVVWFGQ